MTRCAVQYRTQTFGPDYLFNQADGPIGGPWTDAASTHPTRFEPIGVRDGLPCIWEDFQRGGTYQTDHTVHPPSPPGSLYGGIGCAYVETPIPDFTLRTANNLPPTTATDPSSHVEATPLVYIDLDNPLGGFGVWPSVLLGVPVFLIGYMGSPPELFGQPSQPLVALGAMPGYVWGTPFDLRLVAVSRGRVLVFVDGVQLACPRTAGPYRGPLDPLIVDPSLASSNLHGFELDAHLAYPDATAFLPITDFTFTIPF